jgi:hypothetical protein
MPFSYLFYEITHKLLINSWFEFIYIFLNKFYFVILLNLKIEFTVQIGFKRFISTLF